MNSSNYGKSPKIKRNKTELDIERCRAEGKWFKSKDLAQQFRNEKPSSALGSLYSIVMAEVKLEMVTNDKDVIPVEEVREIKEYIDDAINSIDDGYKLEAKILLAKLKYTQKKYVDAINDLEALNLKNIKIEQGSSRLTKLIAEGFAIIGLSMEEMIDSDKNAILSKDNYDKIMDNLEIAGDLCIYHLQELDKSIGTTSVVNGTSDDIDYRGLVSKLISKAIQRSPIIAIKNNHLQKAVDRYRQLLRYCETDTTKSLRQTLSRQLAEVLLRGVCLSNYVKYELETERNPNQSSMIPSTAAMWKQPTKYPNDRFCPSDHNQEVVLLLLISEYLANQEAVLNRSSELKEARISTLYNSQAVYDLLAIALARRHCFAYLSQLQQHALKFSYKEFHSWYQLALSLMSGGQHYRAYLVLKECQRIDDNKPMVFILGAVLCLERLQKIDEGIQMAQRAQELYLSSGSTNMLSRARLLIGRGFSQSAMRTRVIEERRSLQQKAMKQFEIASKDDPLDYQSRYQLAVEQACARQIKSALESCLAAIRLTGNHCASLHLLALLYSASSRLQDACKVIEGAIMEHPNDISLHKTHSRLKLALYGPEAALKAYRGVVEASKDQENEVGLPSTIVNGSITASKLETSSSVMGVSGQLDDSKQCHMESLLGLAELYLECNMVSECIACLDTVSTMGGHNQLLYLRARVLEEQNQLKEARNMYENALSVNGCHIKAQQRLGKLLQKLGQYQFSEKVLRDAVSLDPNNSCTWQLLGELLTEMCSLTGSTEANEFVEIEIDKNILPKYSAVKDDSADSYDLSYSDGPEYEFPYSKYSLNAHSHQEMVAYATKCLTVAADLELTEPIESFYILPRTIKQFW